MGKRTPLYQAHQAAGAKLVDFAGWDMPLHYGSQIEEHHAVRRDAGMFDVSHMLGIDLAGEGCAGFLRGLLANDVAKLTTPGRALYACMLRPDGGVIDDLIVYRFSDASFRLVVNAGTADKDVTWIADHAARWPRAVELRPRRDLAMLAVQGPQAREKVWQALPGSRAASEALKPFNAAAWNDLLIARTGYTGEDGFELMIPAATATAVWDALRAAGVAPAGLGARDTLRLEAGMNLYGQDIDEGVSPLESGLGWTVALGDERDFIGSRALREQSVSRQLLGLVLLDKGVLRSHQRVRTAHGEGETTSGSFAPTLGRAIALARLPLAAAPGETVQVEVRDRLLAALVVKPPFVRHGRALIEL
jgi:aminomethyltransferase